MPKEPAQSYHHKDLRSALIDKGIELVNQDGLRSFSLRKVASSCGVSHAAPYAHFQSKEQLLSAMQNHVTAQFSELLEETITRHGNEPDALGHLGQAYVRFFLDNPHYFTFLFSQSNLRLDLSIDSDSTNGYRPYEIYKELVLGLLEKSGYPVERRPDAVVAIWSFVHGLTSLATMKNVIYPEDWRSKLGDLLGTLPSLAFLTNEPGKG